MTAFLDESGTHGKSSPATVMAGYLGHEHQWAAFEQTWTAFLADYPEVLAVGCTHAKHVVPRRKFYANWPDSDYKAFVGRLLGIVVNSGVKAVLVALTNDHYRDAIRQQAAKGIKKGKLDSAYGLCFRFCMTRLGTHVRNHHPGERLSFMLESGHKNVGDAERIFNQSKTRGLSSLWYPLGNFGEAEKRDYGALQAADLIRT